MRPSWWLLLAVLIAVPAASWQELPVGDIQLLELHGPDGQMFYVAPAHVSSLREPTNSDIGRYFPKNTHCVVVTTNGKFLSAVEMCATIRDRMTAH